jgi:hypothetical protein
MGWLDDACDWVDDNIVDPVTDAADDAADWVEDNVVDPLVDAAEDAVDWVDDNVVDPAAEAIGDYGEWVEETAEDVGEAIEDAWEDVTESLEDLWDDVVEFADKAWDSLVEATAEAWAWLEDKIDEAIDWLVQAVEEVYEFVVEEAIPYIVSLVELIPALIKALGALLILPLCYLYKEIFGEEEATVLQGIAAHEPRLMEEFNIERIPVDRKYAVFSDIHMYVEGDLDFFNNNGNAEIYRTALQWYSGKGYHLVENGDVEDFWIRGGSAKGLILAIGEPLPWPSFSDLFEASGFRSANQAHALNVFSHNAQTYETVRTLFHDKRKYTRMIGNHDDVWVDPDMIPIIQVIYPDIVVNDYCTLERQDTGETEAILAHGHQSDVFNTAMCNFAGKALTNVASVLHELSFGEWNLFSKSKDKWEDEWRNQGFKNELTEISLLEMESFSEYDLYKGVENIYGDSPAQPYLILGHTHNPKDYAGIPHWMFQDQWNWDEYSNSGTVGMWEQIVVGLEVEYPDVRVVAWKKDDGVTNRYELRSYTYGDTFLKPV